MRRFAVLFASCLIARCASGGKTAIALRGPSGEVAGVLAEVADEPEERSRGLMFRKELSPGEGMLFVFEEPSPLVFWMKDTLIPLDIVFFDREGNYVSSDSMVPCEEDPCPLHRSDGEAAYVLEAASDFLERTSIGPGWRLDLSALPAGAGQKH